MGPKRTLNLGTGEGASRIMRPACGHLFVISAPSGAGKSTICKAVIEKIPNLKYSISYTTRNPRGEEKNGVDYYFVSKDDFLRGIQKDIWAEWAEVHGNYYGTSSALVDETLHTGTDIILDIDVQGAKQIVHRYPDSVTVFIMPPSAAALRERLRKRATDSHEDIEQRLINAKEEMAQARNFHHVIINDRLDVAIEALTIIITSIRTDGSVSS